MRSWERDRIRVWTPDFLTSFAEFERERLASDFSQRHYDAAWTKFVTEITPALRRYDSDVYRIAQKIQGRLGGRGFSPAEVVTRMYLGSKISSLRVDHLGISAEIPRVVDGERTSEREHVLYLRDIRLRFSGTGARFRSIRARFDAESLIFVREQAALAADPAERERITAVADRMRDAPWR